MNLITNTKTILADMHTPVSIYYKLRDGFPDAFLLESNDYHDRSDSKSFICLDPFGIFESIGLTYKMGVNGTVKKCTAETGGEIFSALKSFVWSFQVEEPSSYMGFWGYTGFEAVRYFEDIDLKNNSPDHKSIPDMKYQLFRYVLVFDHFINEIQIVGTAIEGQKIPDLDRIEELLLQNTIPHFGIEISVSASSNMTDEEYKDLVEKGIAHCQRGDTFQLVLSRSFTHKYKGDDFNVYRALRSVSPSPYLFYFDYGDFKILGSSPESQLQVKNGIASIRPIAGTVARAGSTDEDVLRAQELREDDKEQSEHVMLVDLARNDLSKNCQEVAVESYAEAQYFSHVIHLGSKVNGKIVPNATGMDIYADTFPAGTLSGAPKYKAMQLINKYENEKRSFYGGAIGFIGLDMQINQAIIIRSALCKNNSITYQAGAGIVSGSTPEGECQEVYNKVAAIRNAIAKAMTL